MHPSHPYLLKRLAEERQHELRGQARPARTDHRGGRPSPRAARPTETWRSRVGWTLVELGLCLACSAPE